MNKNAETYFTKGCGRCSLYDTPKCKVLNWKEALSILRKLLLTFPLKEESKWGSPCYTYNGANVIMIQSFKAYCALMFFKGALIKNDQGFLTKAGENSNSAMQARFTHVDQVKKALPVLKSLIKEAMQIEKDGLKLMQTPSTIEMIPELKDAFKKTPSLKKAFESLTPGRQRGYHIFFSQAKQSATRSARIQKSIPAILAGKGLQD
ncbi:MAG: hypothetical protein RL634_741 [Bacteroidota bacterium]